MLLRSTCLLCHEAGPPLCRRCVDTLPGPPPGACCRSLTAYEGPGRALVTALKFRAVRGVAEALGKAMAARVGDPVDVVTWAPTSARRRQRRGFDQSRLLARAVARELRVPCRGYLRRLPGPAQTGRTRVERLEGPTFVVWRRPPARVLLVDDVVTTGATLAAARAALLAAGARRVLTAAAVAAR